MRFFRLLITFSSICLNLLAQAYTTTTKQPLVDEVSIAQLLVSPERYDGQLVQVRGYLNLAYEAHALYGQADDVVNHRLKSSVWVNFTTALTKEKKVADYNQTYVVVVGWFDARSKGHLGLFGGTLKNIVSLDR